VRKPVSYRLMFIPNRILALLSGLFCAACAGDKDTSTDSGTETAAPETGASDLWADVEPSAGEPDSDWAAQWPVNVTPLGVGAALIEDLSTGETLDLSWAQQSAVACFPANQDDLFSGLHRFFAVQQAADQGLAIVLEPEPGVDLSLYTLQVSTQFFGVPPDIQTAISCDVSLKAGAGEVETLSLWGPNNPYNVIIGVAGIQDQSTGRFLLQVSAED
jgi:hypothetical protein